MSHDEGWQPCFNATEFDLLCTRPTDSRTVELKDVAAASGLL